MRETVIKVENLSKQYRLGQIGTGSFSHDVNRWWHKVRGREDPYLRIGDINDRSEKGTSEYVWSLRDINFEIQQGLAVGVIGRNGAGKSTLLKILSRTTTPTTGNIKIKGRVASLLEVGTGFHPELSGRENVFLNGAILGMTKREITRKFDEIVDFAGVERYIDTPVKRYSSGMYVRLAFGVAAHLEPEILIVDEVLAVGDAEFQQKALGKMQDVVKGQGRTVLFVSHNMAAIQKLCNTALLLRHGTLSGTGDVKSMVSKYLLENQSRLNTEFIIDPVDSLSKRIWIESAYTEVNGVKTNSFVSGDDVYIKIKYAAREQNLKCKLFIGVYDLNEVKLLHLGTAFSKNEVFQSKREGSITCKIPRCPLVAGRYSVNLSLHLDGIPYHHIRNAFNLELSGGDFYQTGKLPDVKDSKFLIEQSWVVQ